MSYRHERLGLTAWQIRGEWASPIIPWTLIGPELCVHSASRCKATNDPRAAARLHPSTQVQSCLPPLPVDTNLSSPSPTRAPWRPDDASPVSPESLEWDLPLITNSLHPPFSSPVLRTLCHLEGVLTAINLGPRYQDTLLACRGLLGLMVSTRLDCRFWRASMCINEHRR